MLKFRTAPRLPCTLTPTQAAVEGTWVRLSLDDDCTRDMIMGAIDTSFKYDMLANGACVGSLLYCKHRYPRCLLFSHGA